MTLYSDAIQSIVSSNDRVVDIGAGTGVLSFIAAQCGAKQVLGIDKSAIIDHAERVKALNFPDAEIQFLRADVLKDTLPEFQADIAICELFGSFGFDENVVQVLATVRKKLLKPNGKILPQSMELLVAPVQCTTAYRQIANWKKPESGIDFSPFQELAYNAVYHINNEPVRILATPKTICSVNFMTVESLPEKLDTEFFFHRDGVIHGIAGWFQSELAPGHRLDTGPDSSQTHWGQIFLPIGEPIRIQAGGSATLEFADNSSIHGTDWSWSGRVKPTEISTSTRKYAFSASRKFQQTPQPE